MSRKGSKISGQTDREVGLVPCPVCSKQVSMAIAWHSMAWLSRTEHNGTDSSKVPGTIHGDKRSPGQHLQPTQSTIIVHCKVLALSSKESQLSPCQLGKHLPNSPRLESHPSLFSHTLWLYSTKD